jgi:hypothetical protein
MRSDSIVDRAREKPLETTAWICCLTRLFRSSLAMGQNSEMLAPVYLLHRLSQLFPVE